ncbi:hypothetical protein ACIA59_10665 [Micromonospora haikouensis]|uniref:hypothetical protein n=1 Tax=Micromonospora haikouensis TaxID=686309 RepID=UPI00379CDB0B
MRGDDLVPLLIPPPGPGLGMRQGVVVAWNPQTAENLIRVGTSLLTNVPILNTNEAVLLAEGSVVALLTWQSSWFILGRITIPGTPEAASALSMVRTFVDQVTSIEPLSSATFTDLATAGPTVDLTIGPSGRCLVMVSCLFDYNGADTQAGGYMSFEISGATSRAANEFTSVKSTFTASDASADTVSWIRGDRMTAASLQTGLTPGAHTITAKYKTVNSCQFGDRLLVAIPL